MAALNLRSSSNSFRRIMNTQQAKDNSLAYLKVVIHLLNENKDELGFGPLRLDDLDRLTSEQMLKLVHFLTRDVMGDKEIFKPTTLTDFNKFGVGNVSYDCGIDNVYHAVKQIFPEDNDLFHYSVLLLPSSNPKRTKAVLSYIMSFVLMCDNLEEQFRGAYNEVMKENEEKVAIYGEVDDLKDKISETIQQLETEKERLPSLQKELQALEENIRKQQNVLAKLNAEVEKHKTTYEGKEMETKKLEHELERINMERLLTEQQIVSNPSEIQAENVSVKNQLDAEMKTRKVIGAELEKCSKECDVFESLIQRAHHVIQSIQSVVALMENTKSKIEYYTKTGNEMSSSSRKLEIQKQELQKLSQQHTNKVAEISRTNKEHELKLMQLDGEVLKTKEQVLQTKNDSTTELSKKNEIMLVIEEVSREIDNLKQQVATCIHNVTEVIPKRRSEKEAEAVKFLERVSKTFNHYPMVKTQTKGKLEGKKK